MLEIIKSYAGPKSALITVSTKDVIHAADAMAPYGVAVAVLFTIVVAATGQPRVSSDNDGNVRIQGNEVYLQVPLHFPIPARYTLFHS